MFINLVKSLSAYFLKDPKAGPPLRALLYLTNRCNLRCLSCGAWQRKENEAETNTEEVLEIIDQLGAAGTSAIYLFGGEPTLRKDLIQIIRHCKGYNIYTEMVTNGAVLANPAKAEELVDSGLDKLCVSIDGTEDIHDTLRGMKGSYRKAMEAIRQVVAARGTAGAHKPLVEVGYTISRNNFACIPGIVRSLNEMGLFEIKLRHMGVFSDADMQNMNEVLAEIGVAFPPLFTTGDSIMLTREDNAALRPELRRLEREYANGSLDYHPHVEPAMYTVDDWSRGRDVPACMHIWTQVSINAYGQVIPCIWYDGIALGDARNGKLMEVWHGEKAAYFRRNYLKLSACRKCCYFYLTFGENFKRALTVPAFPFKKLIGALGKKTR